MKDMLKVSVITVCLNRKEFLESCITSALGQTYKNIEYIIIDGDSNDGSVEIFNKYRDKINKLVIEKDNGIFDAMNKGIALAAGEIIYFLNSDDMFYDNKVIEETVRIFTKQPEIDFIYGNIAISNPVDRNSYIERYPEKISKWLFIKKTIGHPATFFRSSCFEKAGYFDGRYKIAADYEWYLRALYTNKLKSFHVERNISLFQLGGISTNREYRNLYFSERKAIQKRYFNAFELACSGILDFISKNIHA
jgi:glycosyltransferase involved in cell wall biosynthesis